MPAITKNELRLANLDRFKNYLELTPSYVFLSGTSAWDNENDAPTPVDSEQGEFDALSEVFALKKIQSSDIISVIPRYNWIADTIYDAYTHDVNLIDQRNPSTGDFYRFYVFTDENNVYKCLSNNYGVPSFDKPTGTNTAPFTTPDGYIWKYMYTVDVDDLLKFATTNWMPCYTLTFNDGSSQWASQQAATPGTIDNILVTDAGVNYSSINPPTVTITGDGTGATAIPTIGPLNGEVEDITITNPGSGYTYAEIVITGVGNGAKATAIISPRKGHGHDPRSELGAIYMMVKVTVDGNEGFTIPVDLDYRTSGIISMPGDINTQGYIIKLWGDSARFFTAGETLTGETSGASAFISFVDYNDNLLYINNIIGSFSQTENVYSQTFNSTQIQSIFTGVSPLTALVHNANDFQKDTGNVLYVGNRQKITRVENQREDIISIMSF